MATLTTEYLKYLKGELRCCKVSSHPIACKSTKSDSTINFYLFDGLGKNKEFIRIKQSALSANIKNTLVRCNRKQVYEEENEFDFRRLIAAGARKDISALWEAFRAFSHWLRSGVYQNKCIVSSHVDAYQLAEIIQSHRFANCVMYRIIETIPSQKYDPELKEIFRAIHEKHSGSSLLRELYFEAVIFWAHDLYGYASTLPEGTRKILGLDAKSDASLIASLEKTMIENHNFCRERVAEEQEGEETEANVPKANRNVPLQLVSKDHTENCNCGIAPWWRAPARFFTAR